MLDWKSDRDTTKWGIASGEIGKVTKGKAFVVIGLKGKKIIQGDIQKLKAAWQRTLGV